MTRQLEKYELDCKEWQDMVKQCEQNDAKLIKSITNITLALSHAPLWLISKCFSPAFSTNHNSLINNLRTCTLTENIQHQIKTFFVALATSLLWNFSENVIQHVQSVVARKNASNVH